MIFFTAYYFAFVPLQFLLYIFVSVSPIIVTFNATLKKKKLFIRLLTMSNIKRFMTISS